MKNYAEFQALTKTQREADLIESIAIADNTTNAKTVLQKHVAKCLVSMIQSGDCADGEMSKHAKQITKMDIRTNLQSVYQLVAVFTAIVRGQIDLTEADFDTLDTSKLALLSPFLADPDLRAEKLPEAVAALKNGATAKEIRELQGKVKTEPKAVKELREKLEQAEGRAAAAEDRESKLVGIEFGFIATDISKTDPLLKSKQAGERMKRDLAAAMNANDKGTLEFLLDKYTKAFHAICTVMAIDPMEQLTEVAASNAKRAHGKAVDPFVTIDVEAQAA